MTTLNPQKPPPIKYRIFRSAARYLYALFAPFLPATRFFALKRVLLRWGGVQIGNNVRCVSSVKFLVNGPMRIGDDTWVGHEVLFVGGDAEIIIEKSCDIAPRVMFVSGSHVIDYTGPRIAGEGFSLPIMVGAGTWIGAGATILGGTTIGDKCIVAAGAVVKGTFPAQSVIAGVPARIIKAA